jgi:pyrroloquinoline quinone biosynthesis protein B
MRRRSFLHSCIGVVAGLNAPPFSRIPKGFSSHPKHKSVNSNDVLVKVTGTAQDGGIPHMGCFCSNCQRAWKDPRFSRLISSLALFDFVEDKAFLVDATPDIRAQTRIVRERMGSRNKKKRFFPDGVLLTHAHIGHYTGLMFYGYEAQSTDQLPVYGSERMKDFLGQNGPWSQLVQQKNIVIKTILPENRLSLTSQISILAFRVPHRDEYTDTLGFKILGPKRSVLYIPDIKNWKSWDRSIIEEIRKVDIALLDGTFYSAEELPSRDLSSIGHPFIVESMSLLENIVQERKPQIYFTHLNHSNLALNPEGEAIKSMKERSFALAEEGMEFWL